MLRLQMKVHMEQGRTFDLTCASSILLRDRNSHDLCGGAKQSPEYIHPFAVYAVSFWSCLWFSCFCDSAFYLPLSFLVHKQVWYLCLDVWICHSSKTPWGSVITCHPNSGEHFNVFCLRDIAGICHLNLCSPLQWLFTNCYPLLPQSTLFLMT